VQNNNSNIKTRLMHVFHDSLSKLVPSVSVLRSRWWWWRRW